MLDRLSETIVAPITALGGAVAVVRVSGPGAWSVGQRVFSPWPEEALHAAYGRFSHGDDGFATAFEHGRSYTGEESAEFSIHGSQASVAALVEACIGAGARYAQPGEFTLRAFMSGRIDLTQAEGVRDTVEAKTAAQLRQANLMREGALRDEVRTIRDEVVGVLTSVEATTDFSEEVGELDADEARVRCLDICAKIDTLLGKAKTSRIVRNGASFAIAGLANAGKSSLLNVLLSADRAIVTDVAGTTRDTIEESLSINGCLFRLIDTAGVRDTADVVESIGVERSRQSIANADFVIYVYDNSVGWTSEDRALIESVRAPSITVANKCDLEPNVEKGLAVSCKTGEGVPAVLESMSKLALTFSADPGLINQRHAPLLHEAKESLCQAIDTFHQPIPADLAAVDLQAAIRALGEVTGETTPPDVIERIFHDFCIGK